MLSIYSEWHICEPVSSHIIESQSVEYVYMRLWLLDSRFAPLEDYSTEDM